MVGCLVVWLVTWLLSWLDVRMLGWLLGPYNSETTFFMTTSFITLISGSLS